MSIESNTTKFLVTMAAMNIALKGCIALYRGKEALEGKPCSGAAEDDSDLSGCGSKMVNARQETMSDMPLFTALVVASHMSTSFSRYPSCPLHHQRSL